MSGIYSVTVGGSGNCTGTATTSVVVNPTPIIEIAESRTICTGSTLCLTIAVVGGSNFIWKGPNGFSSTEQTPCRTNVTTAEAGIYSVTVNNLSQCSASVTSSVAIINTTATASSNNPCVGNNLNLSAGPSGGSYSWSGPEGFSSTQQNPVISNSTLTKNGIYTLTANFGTCTATATVSVVISNCQQEIDLSLDKSIDNKTPQIGDIVTYVIKIKNEGQNKATDVTVRDLLNNGVSYEFSQASRGSYDINSHTWTIGDVAVGETVSLSISVKVLQEGVWFNTAEICHANEKDVDSTPCNNDPKEDDIDFECFSVPFKLCKGESVTITLPDYLKNIKWFKNGIEISGQTQSVLVISMRGIYTYTASNSTCPANGCCPIEVKEVDCCIPDRCVPFTVVKKQN
ncbi:MAG: DUF11 domain-containing protein [Spirosomataceae bacterium]